MNLTEDEVRTNAQDILKLYENNKDVVSGVGQLTSFNTLGKKLPRHPWKSINDKPDGWYFPKSSNSPALILETKASDVDLDGYPIKELKKNLTIAMRYYKEVLGILYNGKEVRTIQNNRPNDKTLIEVHLAKELQDKDYYLKILNDKPIDVQQIYNLTKQINDSLKFDFGIQDLYNRMIFTAAALVAERFEANLNPDYSYIAMRSTIIDALNKSLDHDRKQNLKLDALVEVYQSIQMTYPENPDAVSKFIKNIIKISQSINSSHWRGEDVMGIFFNEFNRYKRKSDNGQVFTPDHITDFMYRLIDVHMSDVVLDGACGSGSFLTKAMANMMQETGGADTNKSKEIKQHQLYGIEIDKRVYALAAANMMIHKDGRSNLYHANTMSDEAKDWIKSISWDKSAPDKLNKYHITKVLMNPPYERKYKPIDIINSVLDNVPNGTKAAILLPDHKLEKEGKKKVRHLLTHNRLKKIIKLPDETFNEGVSVSIFIFTTGESTQGHEVFTCEIKKDGLITVKNQGRQDIKHRWPAIEQKWLEIVEKQDTSADKTCKWITPDLDDLDNLSYPVPQKPFQISEEDFMKTVMDYEMYKKGIDYNKLIKDIDQSVLYDSDIQADNDYITIKIKRRSNND